jgi:hypothetical protein
MTMLRLHELTHSRADFVIGHAIVVDGGQTVEEAQLMNPRYDFTGQVALVAGGSSGMDLATAQAFR